MTPNFDAFEELLKFAGALSVATGTMTWFRKGSKEEDEIVSESCDILIDEVLDADKVNKIDLHTGRNIRDQLTVEQLEDMERERTLRRFPGRN